MSCYRIGPSVRNCRKVNHTTRFLAARRVDLLWEEVDVDYGDGVVRTEFWCYDFGESSRFAEGDRDIVAFSQPGYYENDT